MSGETFDASELKFKERPAAPSFGPWLGLFAVGLTLGAIQLVALVSELGVAEKPDDALTLGLGIQAFISTWALANLILLLTRRKAFILSAITMLAVFILISLLLVAGELSGHLVSDSDEPLWLVGVQMLVGAAWITYIARSAHVRNVCVR